MGGLQKSFRSGSIFVIDIIDVGSGNIRSIKNWIEKVNIPTRVVDRADDIKGELLIIPGVGSAGSYMSRIRSGGFDKAILEHVDSGGRLLGVCLGLQIMGSFSSEDGGVKCLNLLDGHVEKLSDNASHNGWAEIAFRRNKLNGQSLNNKFGISRKNILKGRVFYNNSKLII